MLTCKYNMLSFILAKEIDFPQYFKDPSTLWGSITMYSLGSGKTATAYLLYLSFPPYRVPSSPTFSPGSLCFLSVME